MSEGQEGGFISSQNHQTGSDQDVRRSSLCLMEVPEEMVNVPSQTGNKTEYKFTKLALE